ncbi:MAG: coenzyme F420-0:L-glutamate ligase [Candidatus Nitrosocaldaceae archaeon]
MQLIPIKMPLMNGRFDLYTTLINGVRDNNEAIKSNDILVISSKFVAMSQGSILEIKNIIPSERAKSLGARYSLDSRIAQIVIDESDDILGGIEGFILAVKDGVLAPNAGIDKSNITNGYIITHPKEPFIIAKELRNRFKQDGKNVGIILNDSRLMPTRRGTIGVAIGVAGFKPVKDFRGREDLFGNKLRVTLQAVADSIATAANLLMGESNESIPLVIVRDANVEWNDADLSWSDLAINHEECIYMKSLRL